MRTRATLLVLYLLVLSAGNANGTYPGSNGRIAFVQGPDIFTMNPDGTDVRQLTNLGPDSGAFWQSWSPDGRQIVFNEFRPPDFLGQLWIMNADGGNQHLLLAEADFHNERPSFTPDGRSVIFTRCRLDMLDTCALFQIQTDGTGLRPVTQFELGIVDRSAQYSPADGSIAFIGMARGGIICAIYLTSSSASDLRRITPAPLSARQPDWSPDGRKIVFSTHCSNPQNEEIWLVNSEGNELRRLTVNGDDYLAGPHDFHPSWSPQGDAIVFERDAPDFSGTDIFVMKQDGSDSKKVFVVKTPARVHLLHAKQMHGQGKQIGKRLTEIEQGGALPRWGPAPR
jgi:Tol biopolymer transport system component